MAWPVYVLLFALGLGLGPLINRAIYDWAWFVECSPSPYSRKPRIGMESRWRWLPIGGWLWTRDLAGQSLYPTARERATQEELAFIPLWTKWSFLRPMGLEVLVAGGVPCLAWYYHSGTWLGDGFRLDLIPGQTTTLWIWSGFHVAMLGLLLIAALIDWDERTIPDQVTTTGLVGALLLFCAWPAARLPNVDFDGLAVSRISPLQVFSPTEFSAVVQASSSNEGAAPSVLGWVEWSGLGPWLQPTHGIGLLTVIGCWTFWALLIVPSLWTTRFGWRKSLWLAWASVCQPQRRPAGLAARRRKINPVTWVALAVWSLACGLAWFAWAGGGERWEAVYSLSVSMALAGLGTWGVRLLAGWVMGREALGFGDVTLMFMIGGAFGWQFALLVFALAPLLAISHAVFRLLFAGDNALAFGPWLSAAAGLILLAWYPVWHEFSRQSLFAMGPFLLAIIAACLGLMPVALVAMLAAKRALGLDRT